MPLVFFVLVLVLVLDETETETETEHEYEYEYEYEGEGNRHYWATSKTSRLGRCDWVPADEDSQPNAIDSDGLD